MKKIIFFMLFLLICISVYFDMTEGTLLSSTSHTDTETKPVYESSPESPPSEAFNTLDEQTSLEVTVEPGQTVLSVVERLHDGPVPASIDQIINDFKELNQGLPPEEIQVDKTYLFPVYHPSP